MSYTVKVVDGKPTTTLPAKDMRLIERFIALAEELSADYCPVSADAANAHGAATTLRESLAGNGPQGD